MNPVQLYENIYESNGQRMDEHYIKKKLYKFHIWCEILVHYFYYKYNTADIANENNGL